MAIGSMGIALGREESPWSEAEVEKRSPASESPKAEWTDWASKSISSLGSEQTEEEPRGREEVFILFFFLFSPPSSLEGGEAVEAAGEP